MVRIMAAVAIVGVAVVVLLDAGASTTSRAQRSVGDVTRSPSVVARVVDGDTLVLEGGRRVRLIGIDTPERGECGFARASALLRGAVEGRRVVLSNPRSVQDEDAYDRLLRYVDRRGRDAAVPLLRRGLALARYDSRDGYDPHPREGRYRSIDARSPSPCGR